MTSLQAQSFSLQGVSMSPHKARRQRTESFKELKICPFLAQRIILKLWIHSCGSLHLVTGTPQASSIQDIFSTTIPLASTLLWWWRRYIREAVYSRVLLLLLLSRSGQLGYSMGLGSSQQACSSGNVHEETHMSNTGGNERPVSL